ncbi:hypothetical protein PYK79_10775 [Streptomyces sp. ID05-04B]|uniref:hypothetical protein n=1 Tax=Streptomyces sp. ID05-04B TaxID=3028661 RepID=UPI0029C533A5|nr:hypothetical protein [Streptomyces sp. ID05-04B]MDX5563736.1 hypothetical protein [Streptomyces sp. ID05-04B]
MVAYPNPEGIEIHFAQLDRGGQLGDLWEAARIAEVKPGTIRVWVTRKKIEPVLVGKTGPVFHLPTVKTAAECGAKHKPADPAANSRGPHRHAA